MDRFDRQLRLWGGFGHGFLADAKVCLIAEGRSEPLLLEVQRHLLLAGISRFVICHSNKTQSGLQDGFAFINQSQELEALNPEAQPQWDFCLQSQIRELSFEDVSVVVLLNCNGRMLQEISERRTSLAQFPPILVSVSACPLAYTHLWLKEPHFVLSTNPEYVVPDLRIVEPWHELSQYMASIDLTQLQEKQLAEVPYPVILFKALGATSQGDGSLLQRLDRYYLLLSPQAFNDPNYRQAKRNVRQAMRSGEIGRERVEQLLDKLKHTNDKQAPCEGHSLNSQMMVLCRALTQYLGKYHQLPVPGDLPDMEAATRPYNELKIIYQERAAKDRQKLQQILVQLGFPNFPKMLIQKFCENMNCWTLLEPSSDENSMPRLYSSGAMAQLIESDSERSAKVGGKSLIRKLHELLLARREDGSSCKFHSPINGFPTTAFLGGVVSQEVVKLVTHQYVPIDNTFVYDVLADESLTFKI